MDEKLLNTNYLLSELQKGKEDAFDYIFRNYYKALCAQANTYVNDLDLSQSLVQDCFIKLWDSRRQATAIENLPAYLSFSVRNRCIDYLRREKRTTQLHPEKHEKTDRKHSDDLLLSREFEEKFVVALSNLPERCRIAFEYSRFEGLTYGEIAAKMNISVKAVEALISRSLKILRTEMKDYLPVAIVFYQMLH